MTTNVTLQNKKLYDKVKVISNQYRFRIIELTHDDKMSITDLSSKLRLSYTKCADYVSLLEKNGLVIKERSGKETIISSKVQLKDDKILF